MRVARSKLLILLVVTVVLGLVLSACAGQGENGQGQQNKDNTKGTIRIGVFNWAENIAAVNLWKHVLEEQGYDVKLIQGEKAVVFSGVSEGSLDLALEVWLPDTDAPYWNKYKDGLEKLGPWYEGTGLGLVVPEYVNINSIEELNANKDKFIKSGQPSIVGIEAGASLMRMTEDAIKEYGLEYNLIEGSEPAMMATLNDAYKNEEPVLVTLWNPHWAFADFKLKYLEDPKNVYGDEEKIYIMANEGFSEQYPEVATWLNQWHMDNRSLGSLMSVINETGDPAEGAKKWLDDNRDLVEEWLK